MSIYKKFYDDLRDYTPVKQLINLFKINVIRSIIIDTRLNKLNCKKVILSNK